MAEKSNFVELLGERYEQMWDDLTSEAPFLFRESEVDRWERSWRQHVRCLFGRHVWRPLLKAGVCPQCKRRVD
jgi:hypothetical protein